MYVGTPLSPTKYVRPLNNSKEEGDTKVKDIFYEKCKKLLIFKNLISDLEEIYEKMLILRVKGCNIPRVIRIEVKYPNIGYYLNEK